MSDEPACDIQMLIMSSRLLLPAVFVLLSFAPMSLSGAVLLSTYGQTANNEVALDFPFISYAVDFETGAAASTVTGLTASLNNLDFITRTAFAEIWSDAGGNPGSLLGAFDTFATLDAQTSAPIQSFVDSGIALDAMTKYWLIMRAGETRQVLDLKVAATNSTSFDAGSVYAPVTSTPSKYSVDGTNWFDYGSQTFIYSLQSEAVPEPGRAALLMISCGALCFRRRRSVVG